MAFKNSAGSRKLKCDSGNKFMLTILFFNTVLIPGWYHTSILFSRKTKLEKYLSNISMLG